MHEKLARSLIALTTLMLGASAPLIACSGSSDSPNLVQGTDGDTDSGPDARAVGDGSIANRDAAATSDSAAPIVGADLPLSGCPQAGYTASFSVGGSPFDLVIDTGSSELGIAGSDCSNCSGVTPLYEPSVSAVNENATTSVSYVSGTGWSGDIFQDSFSAPSSAISASPRLVAIESQTGGFFTNGGCALQSVPFSFQGIAGFGPSSLAKTGTDEPMAALATAGFADIFSVALCGMGGHLWIGGVGAAVAPKYTALVSSDFYAIKVNGLGVAGTSLGFSATDIDNVVVDTDTTEFELPSAVYDAARDAIAGNASFQAHFGGASFFDNGSCIPPLDASAPTPDALDAALPTFTISIDDGAGGSSDITLNATSSYLEPITKAGITYYCPEIETRNAGGSTVLGSAFMREQVVIFDRVASRIGFAPYASCAVR
jgi:hypothetical protein